MRKNKRIILIFIILIIILVMKNISIAKDTVVSYVQNGNSMKIIINNDVKMKKIRIYKKSTNSEYKIFYRNDYISSKDFEYNVPSKRLSTTEKNYLKVVIIDEENKVESKEIDLGIFKEEKPQVSEKVQETTKPSAEPAKPAEPKQPKPSKTPSVQAQKVILNKTKITVDKGKTQRIVATVSPSNAINKTITWETKDKKIATVKNGIITGIGVGTTQITAKTSNGKKATCLVTVTNTKVEQTIEKATQWMEKTVKEGGHKYVNNISIKTMMRTGNYNCIGFVVTGWIKAGVGLNTNMGFPSMRKSFMSQGFSDVTKQVNLKTQKGLQRGDVLIRDYKINGHYHTEQYCGNGKIVGSRGGTPPMSVMGYQNMSWNIVLRYTGK